MNSLSATGPIDAAIGTLSPFRERRPSTLERATDAFAAFLAIATCEAQSLEVAGSSMQGRVSPMAAQPAYLGPLSTFSPVGTKTPVENGSQYADSTSGWSESLHRDAKDTVSIHLELDDLGTIAVRVSEANGVVAAHVCVSDAAVRLRIAALLPEIVVSLRDAGVSMAGIDLGGASESPSGKTQRFARLTRRSPSRDASLDVTA